MSNDNPASFDDDGPVASTKPRGALVAQVRQSLVSASALQIRARAASMFPEAFLHDVDRLAAQAERMRAAFREGIVGYARELQREGCTPEQMIVRVKALIAEATPPDLDKAAARTYLEEAVRACIEGYYAR